MARNFDKFTERSRRVLFLSQQEAERFNDSYIGTEHLLLALVAEGEGIAARVLNEMGVQLPLARTAAESNLGRGQGRLPGETGLTPQAKKVIELAVDEARRLDHSYIGTGHLLLGLLRETESIAVGILNALDVDLDKTRQLLLHAIESTEREPAMTAASVDFDAPREPTTAERLEQGIEGARAEGNQDRVRELESHLARLRLMESDRREKLLVKHLLVEEKRRVALDDEIRRLLREIDQVKAERAPYLQMLMRAANAGGRRKRAQRSREGNDPDNSA